MLNLSNFQIEAGGQVVFKGEVLPPKGWLRKGGLIMFPFEKQLEELVAADHAVTDMPQKRIVVSW